MPIVASNPEWSNLEFPKLRKFLWANTAENGPPIYKSTAKECSEGRGGPEVGAANGWDWTPSGTEAAAIGLYLAILQLWFSITLGSVPLAEVENLRG